MVVRLSRGADGSRGAYVYQGSAYHDFYCERIHSYDILTACAVDGLASRPLSRFTVRTYGEDALSGTVTLSRPHKASHRTRFPETI